MRPPATPDPTDPARTRGESPTIAEVAALTRRLRELSAQGRAADPARLAAFLADKDALLDRITDGQHSDALEPTAGLHHHDAHLDQDTVHGPFGYSVDDACLLDADDTDDAGWSR